MSSGRNISDFTRLTKVLRALVDPVVVDCGAELVDVEISGSTNSHRVRVLVHVASGVTIDTCESISRELADVLDVEDPFPGRYRLEVTSPGLDRPLRTDEDFGRARNRKIKVVTAQGKTQLGCLKGWTDELIEIETGDGCEEIQRAQIAKATIEVEF